MFSHEHLMFLTACEQIVVWAPDFKAEVKISKRQKKKFFRNKKQENKHKEGS